jgi:sigma-B regulation protein RsbU (phosphoserine phosphatase)
MNNQTKVLSALIVEDVESDAQLLVRMLKKAGYELVYEQVETAGQMRDALKKRTWDIIISDYSLPQFSGEGALAILKETGQDIPFIIVSGTMGEETAVAMMKAGAHDYLMKGDLARLVPAVKRELEQAEVRRERRQAQEKLAKSEAELRALVEHVPAIVYTESAETRETTYISSQVERLTGYTPVEWIQDRDLWKRMIHPEDLAAVLEKDKHTSATREPFYAEYRILTRDGRTIWIRDEAVVIENKDGHPLFWQGVMNDITERKQAEESMRNTNILLEQTLEQSPVPMVLVSMPDGIIRSVNSACRRFLGTDDEPSPVGAPLSDIEPSWQDFDMQGKPAIFGELPLPRSLMGLKTDPQERHIIRKDGTSVYGLI